MPPAHHDDPEAAPPRGSNRGSPRVAVVVPTYNEAGNLPLLARRLFALDIPECVLIVVDDGSPDGTGDVALKLRGEYDGRVELIQRGSKQGLGTAYLDGLERALDTGADHIVHMDADLSHAPEYIPGFLGDLDDADVVVGSRYVEGGGSEEEWGLRRRILSMIANMGIRAVTGIRTRDVTSGFKGFRREVLESLDMSEFRCKGFAFLPEETSACQRRGYRVVEHPIVFAQRVSGESKLSAGIVLEAMWRLLPLRFTKPPGGGGRAPLPRQRPPAA